MPDPRRIQLAGGISDTPYYSESSSRTAWHVIRIDDNWLVSQDGEIMLLHGARLRKAEAVRMSRQAWSASGSHHHEYVININESVDMR
jgi:hypothetical protein